MNFCEWFAQNIYSNIFTIITVVVSVLFSWLISGIYYYFGNRTNLKQSVIKPIKEMLEKRYSKENYDVLCEASKEYSVKYMHNDEREALNELKMAYKEIIEYDEDYINAQIILSYFEKILKENNIDYAPIPIVINDEIVDYEPPQDYFYIEDSLYKIFKKYDVDFETEDCQRSVETLLVYFSDKLYSEKNIRFFSKYSIKDVLEQSEERLKWKTKFKNIKNKKDLFLNLTIVKKT